MGVSVLLSAHLMHKTSEKAKEMRFESGYISSSHIRLIRWSPASGMFTASNIG